MAIPKSAPIEAGVPQADSAATPDNLELSPAAKRAALLAALQQLEAENPEIVPVMPEKPRKFRVVHGAVSGYGPDSQGRWANVDFLKGAILEEKNLGEHGPVLFSLGAIVEIFEAAS